MLSHYGKQRVAMISSSHKVTTLRPCGFITSDTETEPPA
jgi:hypothetical protein